MRYVNRYVGVLIALLSFYYLFNFYNLISFDPSGKEAALSSSSAVDMLNGFESLKQRIEFLQNLVETKEKDINSLKTAFSYNVKYYNELVEKQKAILTSLKNNTLNSYLSLINRSDIILPSSSSLSSVVTSGLKTEQVVEFEPSIISNLPHLVSGGGGGGLKNSVNLLQPKFSVSKNRRVDLVIGVPTIKRDKTSYLIETLKSLLDSMNDVEKSQVLVVIIIAEIDDQVFIQDTVEQINKIYKYEVETGLFDIIVPPAEFYPDLSKIERDKVFNDSVDRVKWRTKQNYDFSYLMLYGQSRGKYYLQLEDDVVSKANFVTTVLSFIQKQSNKDWMVIEFSKLGFIGKLFKCEQLSLFVNFFLLFAHDKPIDWLYDLVLDIKICNPEKGQSHCLRSKDEFKLRFKPSLFQHVGTHSSLKGKTQKLKDKDFGKQMLIVAHNNPSATITTSLKTYMKNSIESAYLGQNYFWAMSPAANDYILFEFKKPEMIRKYYVKTGNPEHPDDRLYNATFEIKPSKSLPGNVKLPPGYSKTSDDFYIIDRFSERLGIVNGLIDSDQLTGAIEKIRIRIPVARETWIIISEINFSTQSEQGGKLSSSSSLPPKSKMVSLVR